MRKGLRKFGRSFKLSLWFFASIILAASAMLAFVSVTAFLFVHHPMVGVALILPALFLVIFVNFLYSDDEE